MHERSLHGVLYAEDFDAPEPVVVQVPTPPPPPIVIEPTFSLAELRQAADHARDEVRRQERQAAEADALARSTIALEAIAASLMNMQAEATRRVAETGTATVRAVLAAVSAILPEMCAAHGEAEISGLLAALLPGLRHQTRLVIRLHPSLLETVRARTTACLLDSDVVIDWVGSGTMQPGDVTVRWQDGALVRDSDALCGEIQQLLLSGIAPSHPLEDSQHGH